MIQRLNPSYRSIDAPNVLKRVASFLMDMKENNLDYKNITNEELKQRGYGDIVASFGNSAVLETFINANQSNISSIELKILATKAVEESNNEILHKIASHFKYVCSAYNLEHTDEVPKFIPVDTYAVKRAIICKSTLKKEELIDLLYSSLKQQDFALLCTAGGRKVKRSEIEYHWEGKGRPKL